jgi:hypothetical protein
MTISSQRIAAERDQAERERQRAQKVSNIALTVFAVADPYQTFEHDVSSFLNFSNKLQRASSES